VAVTCGSEGLERQEYSSLIFKTLLRDQIIVDALDDLGT